MQEKISTKLKDLKNFILQEDLGIDVEDRKTIISLIRPTVGVSTTALGDSQIKLGKSKIGGQPDLPAAFQWPYLDNKPMVFCAQYNLSEMRSFDIEQILPPDGMFYVFVGIDEEWGEFGLEQKYHRFLYSNDTLNLERKEFPKDLAESRKINPATIDYFEYLTLPSRENPKLFPLIGKIMDFDELVLEEIRGFLDFGLFEEQNLYHQVLGEERAIQPRPSFIFAAQEMDIHDETEEIKKWKEIVNLSTTYQPVLQLDCGDPSTNLSKFGGSGVFYFGIKTKNLKAGFFEDIKSTFQIG